MKAIISCLVAAVVALSASAEAATTFSYQGKLTNASGGPLTGAYNMTFRLYNDATAGTQVGSLLTVPLVPVSQGLFTVQLDFGASPFNGQRLWLQTTVGGADLSPRTEVTATPYALFAQTVPDGGITSAKLAYDEISLRRVSNGALTAVGGSVGVGTQTPNSKLDVAGTLKTKGFRLGDTATAGYVLTADANAIGTWQPAASSGWGLSGNATAAWDFLGTTNTNALELRVNNTRVMRYEPTTGAPNILGGLGSQVTSGVVGATISGGGLPPWICAVSDDFGTVGGGSNNKAGNSSGTTTDASWATVSGGRDNAATAMYATVSGGDANVASGLGSAVPGGLNNTAAGEYSLAAGYRAKARAADQGAFVWADSQEADFQSTGANQFLIRASGGVGVGTNNPTALLHVQGGMTTALRADSTAAGGNGVVGVAHSGGSAYGVQGDSLQGYGGVFSGGNAGVKATRYGNENYALLATAGSAVFAASPLEDAVSAQSAGASKSGVFGTNSNANGYGVWGFNSSTGNIGYLGGRTGVYAQAGGSTTVAACFRGNVQVLTKSSGTLVAEIGEGLDYAEGFDVSGTDEVAAGTVLAIDSEHPGKLCVSTRAYDFRVAGIAAGANGLASGVRLGIGQYDHDVALAGRVYCNVEALRSAVEPGDLLTTSSLRGYAMKVTEPSRAQGAVLGKAMEPLARGKTGQILVLVTLQ